MKGGARWAGPDWTQVLHKLQMPQNQSLRLRGNYVPKKRNKGWRARVGCLGISLLCYLVP